MCKGFSPPDSGGSTFYNFPLLWFLGCPAAAAIAVAAVTAATAAAVSRLVIDLFGLFLGRRCLASFLFGGAALFGFFLMEGDFGTFFFLGDFSCDFGDASDNRGAGGRSKCAKDSLLHRVDVGVFSTAAASFDFSPSSTALAFDFFLLGGVSLASFFCFLDFFFDCGSCGGAAKCMKDSRRHVVGVAFSLGQEDDEDGDDEGEDDDDDSSGLVVPAPFLAFFPFFLPYPLLAYFSFFPYFYFLPYLTSFTYFFTSFYFSSLTSPIPSTL